MPSANEIIANVFSRSHHGPVPRGELFIYEDFLDHVFPHLKGDYVGQLDAAAQPLGLTVIGIDSTRADAEGLLTNHAFQRLDQYFTVAHLNGPMQRLIDKHGFKNAMLSLRKNQALFAGIADEMARYTDKLAGLAVENGCKAIAIADDIAGNQGIFFSLPLFNDLLLPAYRRLAEVIKAHGLRTFFHSDGDMRSIFELLAEAGYDCIHPIDSQARLTLSEVRERYGEKVAFMGNIDLLAWSDEEIVKEMALTEDLCSKGGFIMGSTGGISLSAIHRLGALYPTWNT